MIEVRAFNGRDVAVFGLGASGIASARALNAGGARVACWDDDEAVRERAASAGLTLVDLGLCDWSDFAALVLSPGVSYAGAHSHWFVEEAQRVGVEILGAVELFAREIENLPEAHRPKIVGVTGTNGKSTTTALLAHILRANNRDVRLAGAVCAPVLSLDAPHSGAIYVLELSSYQLNLAETLKPDVAVFLNISADNLERHGGMDAYVAAQKRIFQRQEVGDTAIVGVDDTQTTNVATEIAGGRGPRSVHVSCGRTLGRGAFSIGGVLYDAIEGRAQKVADLRDAPALRGRHNWQNAAAAYAAARALGLEPRRIADALMSFGGLPHRMEEVARIQQVAFVNDSKASNAAAARHALALYENVYWIAGGRSHTRTVNELSALMPRVAKAYLIGEAAVSMAAELKGRTIVEISRDLKTAVSSATRDAVTSSRADPVVLLSPGCASLDQFDDFEARGDAFRELVRAIPGAVWRDERGDDTQDAPSALEPAG